MKTTRVFMTGNSQVVRLPKEFRIDAERVEILKRGEETVLRPIKRNLEDAFHLLAGLPDDFMRDGRVDEEPQKRKGL
jgi:antitoxin VapB